MNKEQKVSLVLSSLAFILSIITFAVAHTKFEIPDLNIGSFLVSVLAVLVTILIGWQVYTAIKIEAIIDEKIKESEDREKIESLKNISFIAFEFYTSISVLSYISDMPTATRLSFLIGGIIYSSFIDDMPQELLDVRNMFLDYFEDIISKKEHEIIKFSNTDKQIILKKIKQHSNISEFRKLEKILEDSTN